MLINFFVTFTNLAESLESVDFCRGTPKSELAVDALLLFLMTILVTLDSWLCSAVTTL